MRRFFCFPVGGAIAQGLGFSSPRCLRLHLRVCIFHTPLLLLLLQALLIAPCASGVIGALFLPVLLVFPPGARRWCARLLHSGSPPLADSAPGGGRGRRGSGVAPGASASIVRFAGSTAAGGWPGDRIVDASAAGGMGSQATGDCGHRCCWEVRVVCAASSAIITGSLGLRGSAAMAGGLGLQEQPPCSLSSAASVSLYIPL